MKVMFIVYHDIHTDARTQEVLQCAKGLGETYFVSYSEPIGQSECTSLLTGKGRRKFISFIFDSIKYIRKIKPDIIILHDNYTSIILGWLLLRKNRPFIIYDSSELYIDLKPKKIKQRIARVMQYFENKYLKYADVTIAANIERASIMKEYFKLNKMPLIFDNIHRIDDIYDEQKCNKKYGRYFTNQQFILIYAGGISMNRKTYELADSVGKLGNKYQLLVVGAARDDEKSKFHNYIEQKGYSNIVYLGFISRSELRYLLNKSQISVSAFSQDTVNNTYCASGKLYESLFEGTPILTSENPPLKRICSDYKVGVSTNNFIKGIKMLESNYNKYCENIRNYVTNINYEYRIENLTRALKEEIRGKFRYSN